MLPRHTGLACQAKYRLVKNREARVHPQSLGDSRAAGEQSQGGEVEVLEKDTDADEDHGKEDETTSANPTDPNRVPMESTDIEGQNKQDNGEVSMSAGSDGAPEAEEDGGENTEHDPEAND